MKIRSQNINGIKTLVSLPGWARDWKEPGVGGNASVAYSASAWLFRAVQIRGEALISAPLKLYKPTTDGQEEIEDHAAVRRIHEVNTEWNYSDLMRYTEGDSCIFGNAYWRLTDDDEIYRVPPSKVKLVADKTGIKGLERTDTGEMIPRDELVIFRGAYDPESDLSGIAPAVLASNAAMAERNTERYLAAFFANDATPGLIFSTDDTLSEADTERAQAWWTKFFKGVNNSFRAAFLGKGLKPFEVGKSPKDLALADVKEELHKTISTALGVPELLIASTNAADLTPVEMALRIFMTQTMTPRWMWYAETINAEYLLHYPDLIAMGAWFEFDISEVEALRESEDAKVERVTKKLAANIITVDEAREELGYDPLPEEPKEETEEEAVEVLVGQSEIATREKSMWRKKAIKAIRAGKSGAVQFTSDAIPYLEAARIREGLTGAKTEADVDRVFAGHEDGLANVMAELKAARDAIRSAEDQDTTNGSGQSIAPQTGDR